MQELLKWKDGDQFNYYDFWRDGIGKIYSEEKNDESKIYLTTCKAKELKRHGLFEGTPPMHVRFSYLPAKGPIQSQRDVRFMYNQICIILNNVLYFGDDKDTD